MGAGTKGVMMMTTWKLRSCPRCKGDMFIEREGGTWYQQCLQCSYRCEMRRLDKVQEKVTDGGGVEPSPPANICLS